VVTFSSLQFKGQVTDILQKWTLQQRHTNQQFIVKDHLVDNYIGRKLKIGPRRNKYANNLQ